MKNKVETHEVGFHQKQFGNMDVTTRFWKGNDEVWTVQQRQSTHDNPMGVLQEVVLDKDVINALLAERAEEELTK